MCIYLSCFFYQTWKATSLQTKLQMFHKLVSLVYYISFKQTPWILVDFNCIFYCLYILNKQCCRWCKFSATSEYFQINHYNFEIFALYMLYLTWYKPHKHVCNKHQMNKGIWHKLKMYSYPMLNVSQEPTNF